MTLDEAEIAAGVAIQAAGDGVYDSPTLPATTQDLHLHLSANNTVECVGAGENQTAQTVTTADGVKLGDPVQHLLAVYGARARYVPAPTTGMTTNAGYVVAEAGGALAFVIRAGTIAEIEGGGPDTTPNSCTG